MAFNENQFWNKLGDRIDDGLVVFHPGSANTTPPTVWTGKVGDYRLDFVQVGVGNIDLKMYDADSLIWTVDANAGVLTKIENSQTTVTTGSKEECLDLLVNPHQEATVKLKVPVSILAQVEAFIASIS